MSDGFRFFADEDVLRHDRAGEAAVLDREESVFISLGSLIEVRTLRAQAAIATALGAGGVAKSTAPSWLGSLLETETPSSPKPQAASPKAARMAMAVISAGRTRRASYCLDPITLFDHANA